MSKTVFRLIGEYMLNILAGLSVSLLIFHYKVAFFTLANLKMSFGKLITGHPLLFTLFIIISLSLFLSKFFNFLSILKIGVFPYALNQKYFVLPSKRDDKRLRSSFCDFIKLSRVIDVLMINGKTFYDNPSDTNNAIKQELISKIKSERPPNLNIYLLDPDSDYVKKRAEERWPDINKKVNQYLKNHKENINKVIADFGKDRVFFYDIMPVFQVFRFCDYIFVSSYLKASYGASTIQKGFLKLGMRSNWLSKCILIFKKFKTDLTTHNDFDIFEKYLEFIKSISISANQSKTLMISQKNKS